MSKPTAADIVQQFNNAPRLDPTGQPRSNSQIPDQQGGAGSRPGRPSPVGGPPTGERLGGHTDRQVPGGSRDPAPHPDYRDQSRRPKR